MYDDATESGQPPLTRVRFEQYLFSIGIVGLEDDMQDVLQKFDTDQNGIIGWEAFAAALMRIVRKEHHGTLQGHTQRCSGLCRCAAIMIAPMPALLHLATAPAKCESMRLRLSASCV